MKKLLMVLLMVMTASTTFAAGTLTGGQDDWVQSGNTANVYSKTVTWVDDTAGTTGTITVPIRLRGALVLCAETDPGATAPTANYDIVLTKSNGVDTFGSALNNLSATASEIHSPWDGPLSSVFDQNITFTLSGNSVNNATGTLTIYIYLTCE